MIEYGKEINSALKIRETPDADDLIRTKLAAHGYLPVVYDPDPVINPDTHYIQLTGTWTVGPSDITRHKESVERTEENKKAIADQKQRVSDIAANLPSWTQVTTAINAISNIKEVKAVMKKMARITYWLAKNDSE